MVKLQIADHDSGGRAAQTQVRPIVAP